MAGARTSTNGSFDPAPYFTNTYAGDDVVDRYYGGWKGLWDAIKRSLSNE